LFPGRAPYLVVSPYIFKKTYLKELGTAAGAVVVFPGPLEQAGETKLVGAPVQSANLAARDGLETDGTRVLLLCAFLLFERHA
jgi:hypothetical protein